MPRSTPAAHTSGAGLLHDLPQVDWTEAPYVLGVWSVSERTVKGLRWPLLLLFPAREFERNMPNAYDAGNFSWCRAGTGDRRAVADNEIPPRRAARDGATRHSVAGPSAGAARVLLIVGYFAPVPVKRDTESAREFA